MQIRATQMIDRYSVNSDLIQKSFKLLALLDSVCKNFKAIVSVVVLVGATKIAHGF